MKTKPLLIAVFLVAGPLSGCKKQVGGNDLKISYGTFFSMCVGYCSNQLLMTKDKMELIKLENKQNAVPKVCVEKMTENDWNALTERIDLKVFQKLKESYGCPDCADGGGEWVQIEYDGQKHKVTFEYGDAPEEMKPYISELRTHYTAFKDCN